MQPKFNFYDFVGYLIPGTIFLLTIYWTFLGLFVTNISLSLESLGDSFLFVVFSYTFGHIIQSYTNTFENKKVKKQNSWESDDYLKPNDSFYSLEFKNNLYEAIKSTFNIDIEKEVGNKNKVQEVFNLCYSLVVQKNISSQTDMFNGLYSLYRGLNTVKVIVFYSGLLITMKQIIFLIIGLKDISIISIQIADYDPQMFLFGIFITCVSQIFSSQLLSRCKRFSNRFADSVYRSFYVWYATNPK